MGNNTCCVKMRSHVKCLEKDGMDIVKYEDTKLQRDEYERRSAFSYEGLNIDYCLSKPGYYRKDDSLSNAEYRKAEKESLFTGEEEEFVSFADNFVYIESEAESERFSSKSFGVPLKSCGEPKHNKIPQIKTLEQMLLSENETVNSHITKMYSENMSIMPTKKAEDFDWFENLECIDPKYLNEYETGKKIDKDYIINFFNMMKHKFEQEEWTIRCDRPETKCWNSPEGSPYSKKHLCVHVEGWMSSKYPHEMVVDAIQNTSSRLKWDKNIAETQFVERIAKNAYIRRTKTKKMPVISPRDILEKKIILKVKNKSGNIDTYIYSSSVPDSFYEEEKGIVRATNLFCVLRLKQLKDGRTKYESFAQADPKIFGAMFVFKRLCGLKIKEWYKSIIEFLDAQLEAKKE
ncbi:unnamed protein product [Moneuplotes crassus]|uniref:START domain-containing protein n=1 Tax=Euplotes crassus TaxID=5936 RepID=A0AAD1UGW1_EUPCR|nr:unnamed protein product [Moneuplotes crassus]